MASAANPRSGPSVIVVRDGYHPATVDVPAGRPVLLAFRREERTRSSQAVLLAGLGRYVELPPGRTTVVEIGALKAGDYPFSSPDGLLQGTLRVH